VARVTVVDDDEDLRELLTEVVGELGHTATAAGRATVDELAASQPDLLVLDLVLEASDDPPGGWDLVTRARHDPRLRSVPIVLTTAVVPELREREHEIDTLGHIRVLAKPFGVDELEAAIRDELA
jgi:CheY-like chemotaxis protein